MRPDLFWHYKHLLKQYVQTLLFKTKHVDVQALVSTWEVVGVDISYWQGAIDWDKLASMVDFVIIRAQYGNDWYDPLCDEYRNAAEAQIANPNKRLKAFGLYCFPKPRKAKNWETTAKNFFLKWKEKPGNIPPTFDLENSGGLDKNDLGGWYYHLYQEFMILSKLPLEKIMTYTSAGYLNRAIALTDWLKLTLLWVANWTSASQPTLPTEWSKPGKTWKFWQWLATGLAKNYGILGSRYVDLNRYNGTKEQFAAEFGLLPPPPPPGDDDMIAKVLATPFLNVRSGPGSNYSDVGDMPTSSTFKVKNVLRGVSPACSVWLQIKDGQFEDKWACLFDGTKYLSEIVV